MLWVCAALAVIAVGTAIQQGRGPEFYTPANLKAEAEQHQHFFVYSKWLNRHFDVHKQFPADMAEFATAAREQKGEAASLRTDPWGTDYQLTLSPTWFSVRSAGPDRTFFTEDDRLLRSLRPEAIQPAVLTAAE